MCDGPVKRGDGFSYKKVNRLRFRDFVYPKLMAWEGAFAMVPSRYDGFVVSPEFQVFRTDEDVLLPEVLDTYFRSSFCLDDVRAASSGTNVRRRRLHPTKFLELNVPVPPKNQQQVLRELYLRQAELERQLDLQKQEFVELLDSIVATAVRGHSGATRLQESQDSRDRQGAFT